MSIFRDVLGYFVSSAPISSNDLSEYFDQMRAHNAEWEDFKKRAKKTLSFNFKSATSDDEIKPIKPSIETIFKQKFH